MSNFIKRLILTLISIPFVMFSIFWPQNSHIIIVILFGILITFLGSYEFGTLIFKKGIKVRKYFLPVINSIIYIFAYFYANNLFNIQGFKPALILFFGGLIGVTSFIFARDIFKIDFKESLEKVGATLFGILYIGLPSFFVPFILNVEIAPVKPTPLFFNIESHGTLTGSFLAIFLMLNVFSNDIFSYVFGMAFGRKNIAKLKVSPKKSWAGYIGGFFSTLFWITVFYVLFDIMFEFIDFPWWFYYSIFFISGFLIPIGDLVESVFKRSVSVKDSGNIMLGRGGVLDSVDTVIYYIPIFFVLLQLYFAFIV